MYKMIKTLEDLAELKSTMTRVNYKAVLSIVENAVCFKMNNYLVMSSFEDLPKCKPDEYYLYGSVVLVQKHKCNYICVDAPDSVLDIVPQDNYSIVKESLELNDIKELMARKNLEFMGTEELSKELTMARAVFNLGGLTDTAKTFDCLVAFHCLKEGTPIEEIRFSRQKEIIDDSVKSFNYLSASSGDRKIAIVEVGVEGYRDLTLEQIFTTFNKPVDYTIVDLVEEFALTSRKFIRWD